MEFDRQSRTYEPTEKDHVFIGQHQPVKEHDEYQMGRLVERCRDTISVNGGDPSETEAGEHAEDTLGLMCENSGAAVVLRNFTEIREFRR